MKPKRERCKAGRSHSGQLRAATHLVARVFSIGLASALLMTSESAHGTTYCDDITHELNVVGEARYKIVDYPYTDEAYANSYWDNGAELALDRFIGAAEHNSSSLGFAVYAFFYDNSTYDSGYATFMLTLDRSTTQSGGCPADPFSSSATYVVNLGQSYDYEYAGKVFSNYYLEYKRYWRAIVSVNGFQTDASDDGCFEVYDETQCEIL